MALSLAAIPMYIGGARTVCRVRWWLLGCLSAVAVSCGCRKPVAAPSKAVETQPALPTATTTSAPTSRPVDPAAPVRVDVKSVEDEQEGWLRIEKLYEKVPGGWASAHRATPHRIVVETDNVHQFSIDTSQLQIDWSSRVWVRINRYAFELTHKRHPVVHLRETRAGAWEVVEVHDAPSPGGSGPG